MWNTLSAWQPSEEGEKTKWRRGEHLNKNPLTWILQIPGRAAVVRTPPTQHSTGKWFTAASILWQVLRAESPLDLHPFVCSALRETYSSDQTGLITVGHWGTEEGPSLERSLWHTTREKAAPEIIGSASTPGKWHLICGMWAKQQRYRGSLVSFQLLMFCSCPPLNKWWHLSKRGAGSGGWASQRRPFGSSAAPHGCLSSENSAEMWGQMSLPFIAFSAEQTLQKHTPPWG